MEKSPIGSLQLASDKGTRRGEPGGKVLVRDREDPEDTLPSLVDGGYNAESCDEIGIDHDILFRGKSLYETSLLYTNGWHYVQIGNT
jgi:hypothetical protein